MSPFVVMMRFGLHNGQKQCCRRCGSIVMMQTALKDALPMCTIASGTQQLIYLADNIATVIALDFCAYPHP